MLLLLLVRRDLELVLGDDRFLINARGFRFDCLGGSCLDEPRRMDGVWLRWRERISKGEGVSWTRLKARRFDCNGVGIGVQYNTSRWLYPLCCN